MTLDKADINCRLYSITDDPTFIGNKLMTSTVLSALRNIDKAFALAFDITGTVVKVSYLSSVNRHRTRVDGQIIELPVPSSFIHSVQFHVDYLDAVLDHIVKCSIRMSKKPTISVVSNHRSLHLEKKVESVLNAQLNKVDELQSLVKGTDFLLRNVLDESFRFVTEDGERGHKLLNDPHPSVEGYGWAKYAFDTIDLTKPYLIVCLGTGLSIVRVEGDGTYRRLRGSSIGTGTFLAMANLAFGVQDLDTMVRLAARGDNKRVDTVVGDIYGRFNGYLNLNPNLTAGSFGKLGNPAVVEDLKKSGTLEQDGIRSLLMMLAFNISQIAVLSADLEKERPIGRIFFDGALIRNYPLVMKCIAEAVSYWSGGRYLTHFFRHEGYAEVIGCLLQSSDVLIPCEDEEVAPINVSWRENHVGCSEIGKYVPKEKKDDHHMEYTSLELMCVHSKLDWFSLLDSPHNYSPDTRDFQDDHDSRQMWIDILGSTGEKVMARAVKSQISAEDATKRGRQFFENLTSSMELLARSPQAHGSCNARDLLDIREQLLLEFGFDDVYVSQKAIENDRSFEEFLAVCKSLDEGATPLESVLRAVMGLLAGNVFDWGAKEVVAILQSQPQFSFNCALNILRPRPWLVDGFDRFAAKLLSGFYKSSVVFCDNSGADFVLGILPFARELLKRNVKVIIAVNQMPALNDMTYDEALPLMERGASMDPILKAAWQNEDLVVCHNGQASPCLDLRQVNCKLSEVCLARKVDLIVIEGMGRALHTNLEAKFTVDCIKAAVIKTEWLAKMMGGVVFDSVFRLDEATSTPASGELLEDRADAEKNNTAVSDVRC